MISPDDFLRTIFLDTGKVAAVTVARTVKREGRICSPCVLFRRGEAKCEGPQYVLQGGRAFYFLDDLKSWIATAPRLCGTGRRHLCDDG